MSKLGIVEVGSTFTKGYVAHGGGIEPRPIKHIEFKKHFEQDHRVRSSDVTMLTDYVGSLLAECDRVHVLGTSTFRGASEDDIRLVRNHLEQRGNATFEVVSAAAENKYTCYGATRDIDYAGTVGVMVGGGGSTEVAIYQGGEPVAEALTPIGVGDVNRMFPDLAEDVAHTDPLAVAAWITEHLAPIEGKANLLVLAGGDFPLLYKNAGYNLQPNPYSHDPEKPYILRNADKNKRDKTYFGVDRLDTYRPLTPDTPRWWDGSRAMCGFVNAVATQLGAETLVPTRISMVFGVAATLRDS